jgi:ABC transporter substrate binding protein
MNNRRKLLVALGAGALATPFCAFAQLRDRPARIATLSDANEDSSAPLWAMFRKRLHELGYVEGTSYVIESRWANGDSERLPALAAELAALKPGVIVADGTPSALAAKQATVSIPIVAIRIADPVKAGLAASLARPGGNLTGTTIVTTNIAGKWLELLREVAPGVRSLAFLNDTSNAGAMLTFRELQEQARPLGVKVQALDGRNRSNVEQAFSAIARADGWVRRRHQRGRFRATPADYRGRGAPAHPCHLCASGIRGRGRVNVLRDRPERALFARGGLRAPHSAGRKARRFADRATNQIRACGQSQNRESAWPHDSAVGAAARG